MSAMIETSNATASVTFQPEECTVEVDAGSTILQAARKAGVHIDAPCAEHGRCGKCRVRVRAGLVSEVTPEEEEYLTPAELANGMRLSCMTSIFDDVVVTVPESSKNLTNRKATAALPYSIVSDPYTRKFCVSVAKPSITTHDLRDDLVRLREALPAINTVELSAIRDLHSALVDGDYTVTAVLAHDRLIAVEAGDTTNAHYGVALDIGTTTIVGYLLDLNTGQDVAVAFLPNPQATYGGDVISRIEFAQGNPVHIEQLRQSVTGAVNQILQAVATDAQIEILDIYEMIVVGNTCMSHLFLGIDPISLGQAPYTPVVTQSLTILSSELGLAMHPNAQVRTLPNIAGFVGADTVGVLAASDLAHRQGVYVAVDIGTNAEVMVGLYGKVTACSTAAGPAFEGARISQGMRAQSGAIDGVTIGQDLFVHTIGDVPAQGICGSGIIDAIGELLRVEMLESSGSFADPDDLPALPTALRERLTAEGVVLVWARESGVGHDIVLTRRDVREIQLVKGAIYAGVATLLEKVGRTPEEVDGLFIAGAFGTYITKEHALAIGLIPNMDLGKLVFLGNAAGSGAKMALISQREFETICVTAQQVGYIELAGDLTFSDNFMMAMTLAPGCQDE